VLRNRLRRIVIPTKAATGIDGFDAITGGGVPDGRTTLVVGGPGSGKTIFALQFLVHGARQCQEPAIFVAFEESPDRIATNFESFGWNVQALAPKKLYFMDARPTADLLQSGDFDLGGMLAALGAQAKRMGARRIAFDALDVVLSLLPDAAARRREIHRLHDWALSQELTCIITAKAGSDETTSVDLQPFGFLQFMVDCAVVLNHRVVQGVSQRNLRVQKYRGSPFEENESPFVIGIDGFDVAVARMPGRTPGKASYEHVTTGVARLDTMLGGGYYRSATVLITGFPGTAKTTLSGAFAEAACRRGERTLFVSFDSDAPEVIRNLNSVQIQLQPHVKSGILQMVSARTILGSAETLLVRIKALAKEHQARCMVIDPVSTLAKTGNEMTAHGVAERLIDWCKADNITLVCTSLLDEANNLETAGKPLQISTLADTWIHLSYLVQAGERNRGISIIKSRGASHSNQVRELILSNTGITLADIYTAGGDVLMGTLRWEKETALRTAAELAEVESRLKRLRLDAEEAELKVRLKTLHTELLAKQIERTLLIRTNRARKGEIAESRVRVRQLRGADRVVPRRK
jgi:circadian clock protein KaiC